jgi:hypothetical protein
MPIARPLSCGSHKSAIVPAPTAWTEADAPPLSNRITISIAIDLETAHSMLNMAKRQKDTMYIVRRPSFSLKDDHHSGKMDILSMYNEILRFATVVVECSSAETWEREAGQGK